MCGIPLRSFFPKDFTPEELEDKRKEFNERIKRSREETKSNEDYKRLWHDEIRYKKRSNIEREKCEYFDIESEDYKGLNQERIRIELESTRLDEELKRLKERH